MTHEEEIKVAEIALQSLHGWVERALNAESELRRLPKDFAVAVDQIKRLEEQLKQLSLSGVLKDRIRSEVESKLTRIRDILEEDIDPNADDGRY